METFKNDSGSRPSRIATACSTVDRDIGPDAANRDVEAFAHAVARPGQGKVLLIDEGNHGAGWAPLADAVESGCAFGVLFRYDLACFDADADDAPEATEQLVDELHASGLLPVVWASGSPGHRQIVVRIADYKQRKKWNDRADQLGMVPRTRSRPPLAPHRLGLPVELILPVDSSEALKRLKSPLPPSSRRRITKTTWGRIRRGDAHQPSGSEVIYQICRGLVASGWDCWAAYDMLKNPENLGGESLQNRIRTNEHDATKWFAKYVWAKAEEYCADHPPITDTTTAQLVVVQWQAEAQRSEWRPVEVKVRDALGQPIAVMVSVSSLRKGVQGITDLALKGGTITPFLGLRAFQEAAGFGSRTTAQRVLIALSDLGWITLVQEARGAKSAVYKLSITSITTAPTTARTDGPQGHGEAGGAYLSCGTELRVGDDLFAHGGGLGYQAELLLRHLDDQASTAQELADLTGIPVSSVRVKLKRMEALDMCKRSSSGHWVPLPFDADEAARTIGTAGKGQRLHRRNQIESAQRADDVRAWAKQKREEEAAQEVAQKVATAATAISRRETASRASEAPLPGSEGKPKRIGPSRAFAKAAHGSRSRSIEVAPGSPEGAERSAPVREFAPTTAANMLPSGPRRCRTTARFRRGAAAGEAALAEFYAAGGTDLDDE